MTRQYLRSHRVYLYSTTITTRSFTSQLPNDTTTPKKSTHKQIHKNRHDSHIERSSNLVRRVNCPIILLPTLLNHVRCSFMHEGTVCWTSGNNMRIYCTHHTCLRCGQFLEGLRVEWSTRTILGERGRRDVASQQGRREMLLVGNIIQKAFINIERECAQRSTTE